LQHVSYLLLLSLDFSQRLFVNAFRSLPAKPFELDESMLVAFL